MVGNYSIINKATLKRLQLLSNNYYNHYNNDCEYHTKLLKFIISQFHMPLAFAAKLFAIQKSKIKTYFLIIYFVLLVSCIKYNRAYHLECW